MPMTSKDVLDDLRAQGFAASVLYANDIAKILGKTRGAVYSLKADEGLPFPIIEVGGRPAVSIYAAAAVLAGEQPPASKPSIPDPAAPTPMPAPKRKRADLGALRRSAALAFDFYAQLDAELERVELGNTALIAERTTLDLGRDGSL